MAPWHRVSMAFQHDSLAKKGCMYVSFFVNRQAAYTTTNVRFQYMSVKQLLMDNSQMIIPQVFSEAETRMCEQPSLQQGRVVP